MTPHQLNLFAPAAIVRPAPIAAGTVFVFAGRALRVHRVTGADARAPVILEELAAHGGVLKGQFALWSFAAVARAIKGGTSWRS